MLHEVIVVGYFGLLAFFPSNKNTGSIYGMTLLLLSIGSSYPYAFKLPLMCFENWNLYLYLYTYLRESEKDMNTKKQEAGEYTIAAFSQTSLALPVGPSLCPSPSS